MSSLQPAGPAGGALAGQYPYPALGFFHGVGPALFDDFHWVGSSTTRPGWLQWVQTTITSAPTHSDQTGTDTEQGVRRIATAAIANTGGVLRGNGFERAGPPPIGAIWYAKLRGVTTQTDTITWSGFGSVATTIPSTANATEFVGVRRVGSGNWFGVCKDGAASETTVDLGVDASVWRSLGFQVVDVGSGVKGIQFLLLDFSSRLMVGVTPVGAVITTTLPTALMYAMALGHVTTAASSRIAEIDFWGLGGRTAR